MAATGGSGRSGAPWRAAVATEVRADAVDSYNRARARGVAGPVVVLYVLVAIANLARHIPDVVLTATSISLTVEADPDPGCRPAAAPPPVNLLPPYSNGIAAVAADSGLRMTLHQPFPGWMVAVHGICATALFSLALYQKHTVAQMATAMTVAADPGRNDATGGSVYGNPGVPGGVSGGGGALARVRAARAARTARAVHGMTGYMCLVLAAVMDVAGFALCKYSKWPHFETFSYGFALPWLVWILTIWATASAKNIRSHRFFGNMMVKGCIAVPLSRLAGAVLQRSGFGEERGYYVGIAGVSVLVTVWLVGDAVQQFTEPIPPPVSEGQALREQQHPKIAPKIKSPA